MFTGPFVDEALSSWMHRCGTGSDVMRPMVEDLTPPVDLDRDHRGTPTLFINGQRYLAGYDEATLGAALAAAIKER
jgi:hypothetical protein